MNNVYFIASETPTNLVPGLFPRNSREREKGDEPGSESKTKNPLRKSQTTSDINERNKENDEKREKVTLPYLLCYVSSFFIYLFISICLSLIPFVGASAL